MSNADQCDERPSSRDTKTENIPTGVIAASKRGWKVLPCQAQSKIPLIKAWPKRATSDLGCIESWSKQHLRCNWAAMTGPESGFFVLDIDGADGQQSMDALAQAGNVLPSTLTVITARGKHLYFLCAEGMRIRNSAGRLGPGLDVRGSGG
jgi:hypothetical protein